ncbi:MAG: hypothetical protein NW207_10070 [Cytophagales bacterium]|nr:hypothetical protein [Cytophagales bacterium]
MKIIALPLLFFITISHAQELKTLTGKVSFSSALPTQLVDAYSEQLMVKYDTLTQKLNFKVLISSFQFSNCSREVEKYFNDIYMESNRYHWASFEGNITDTLYSIPNQKKILHAMGNLSIHGVSVKRNITGYIYKTLKNEIVLESNFNVTLAEHGIKILPDDITRLAPTVQVNMTATLKYTP